MKLFYTGRMAKRIRTFAEKLGFTLIEVITIIVIVSLLALVLVPGTIRARQKRLRTGCVNNLKQVGLAFRLWSGDHADRYPMTYSTNQHGTKEYLAAGEVFRHFQIMSNQIVSPSVLICPTDNRLPAKDLASLANSNISYFVNADAEETTPQTILIGDRNLVVNGSPVTLDLLVLKSNDVVAWGTNMHNGQGNVGVADGSVQQITGSGLQPTGTNIYRLAIP